MGRGHNSWTFDKIENILYGVNAIVVSKSIVSKQRELSLL